jgi:hypothetical protein
MPPEDLAHAIRKRPFEPFRIVLTEGSAYDIRHPDLVMPGRRSAIIGLPRPDDPERLYERYVTVDLLHIVRMEALEPAITPGNGASGS